MKKNSTIYICLGLFAILTYFSVQINNIPEEGKSYPLVMLIASYILNGILLISTVIKVKKDKEPNTEKNPLHYIKTVALYAALILLYILGINIIGYIASTWLFIFLSLLFLKAHSKRLLIIYPLVFTAAVYVIFTYFLMVSLPTGTLFGGF